MPSALTFATAGMNAASQRLVSAVSRVSALGTGTLPDGSGGALPPAATVDLSATALDLIESKTSFALNVAVARSADRMTKQTLDILA